MKIRILACIALLGATLPAAVHADADNEARLRDQLRQTITQLRQMQDSNSELQMKLSGAQNAAPKAAVDHKASRAELDRARNEARQEMKQELAQAQADRDAARAQVAALQQQLADAGAQVATARAAAAAAGDAVKQVADSRRRAETCEKDNRELVDISAELLQRYHDMGVWQALWQSEPLTGLARMRREKFVEKYRGAIVDATEKGPADNSGAGRRAE